MGIQADFAFAKNSGEFSRQAPLLRYVAAINPQLSKHEFVAAAVAAGYHSATASIQFAQSRRCSVEDFGDCQLLPDGRLEELAVV